MKFNERDQSYKPSCFGEVHIHFTTLVCLTQIILILKKKNSISLYYVGTVHSGNVTGRGSNV